MASPLDGIGLLMSCSGRAALVAGTRALAQNTASVFMKLRRESRVGKVIFPVKTSGNGGYRASQVYSRLRIFQGVLPDGFLATEGFLVNSLMLIFETIHRA
jgi:hypothetical protein